MQISNSVRRIRARIVWLSAFFVFLFAESSFAKAHGRAYVSGELIVKFHDDIGSASRAATMNRHGHILMEELGRRGIEHIKLNKGESVEAAIAAYQNEPGIDFVAPNYYYYTSALPDDPLFSQQWSLHNTGQTVVANPTGPDPVMPTDNPGTSGADMGLESAWDQITDCSSVVVAVVDSGVNYNHQDLAANMWNGGAAYPNHGYNFVDNNDDPMDLYGHGTHVSGIIAAVGNNGVGTTGVCWKASLMAVRVTDAAGRATSANVAKGIIFAVTNGAKVINLSLGQPNLDPTLQTAVSTANTAGVVLVTAAGNYGEDNDTTPIYPCSFNFPNIICVAALDQSYALASFSNYGASTVHVAAPGVNVVSTWSGTDTTVTDALTSGWTFRDSAGASWGYETATGAQESSFNVMVNPFNYDGKTVSYSSQADAWTYKKFNLSGADSAVASFYYFLDVAPQSGVVVEADPSGGDPSQTGSAIGVLDQSTGGQAAYASYDVGSCLTATCSFGLELEAEGGVGHGIAVALFGIQKLQINPTSYDVLSGTSMAAPHVTGLVAMILAYNPSYTPADAIQSVENGGTSIPWLAGKTTTGKAVNAMGSLSYIEAPTGVSAVKE